MRNIAVCILIAVSALLPGCDQASAPTEGEGESPSGEGEGEASAGEGEGEGEGQAGEGEGEGSACGALPISGECSGSVVRYCDPETQEPTQFDCLDFFPGTTVECYIGNDGVAACGVPRGEDCSYVDGGSEFIAPCTGNDACIFPAGGTTELCAGPFQACSGDDAPQQCLDPETLSFQCFGVEHYGAECPSGSTCDDDACVGIALGAPCQDPSFRCTADAICLEGSCVRSCASISGANTCIGGDLFACDSASGSLVQSSCADAFPGIEATCFVNSAEVAGCGIERGDRCTYLDNGQRRTAACVNPVDACLLTIADGASVCVGPFASCAAGDNYPLCLDEQHIALSCISNQNSGFECPTGSTCSDNACRGAPEGSFCAEPAVLCADGLGCLDNTCVSPCSDFVQCVNSTSLQGSGGFPQCAALDGLLDSLEFCEDRAACPSGNCGSCVPNAGALCGDAGQLQVDCNAQAGSAGFGNVADALNTRRRHFCAD